MSASLLRFAAHVDDRLAVGCPRCLAEAPHLEDTELRRCAWLVWDGAGGDFLYGHDANGWLVVSYRDEALSYCPAHDVRECLRHAAHHFGVELPEGLR